VLWVWSGLDVWTKVENKVENKCGLFNKTDCKGDSFCAWNQTTGECIDKTGCDRYTGAGDQAQGRCDQLGGITDECVAACATCENDTCSAVGQVCNDTNTDRSSLGDWECICPQPRSGKATAAVAACHFDECSDNTNSDQCTGAGQTCVDNNQDWAANQPTRPNDWECICADPSHTRQTAAAASPCVYDECTTYNATCTAEGQQCNDPNATLASQGDWTCDCPPPSVGQGAQRAANCTHMNRYFIFSRQAA